MDLGKIVNYQMADLLIFQNYGSNITHIEISKILSGLKS